MRLRSLNPDQKSYFRGRQYEIEKKAPHRPVGKGYQGDTLKTKQRVAKEHDVSTATIARDLRFARAVDTISAVTGNGTGKAILSHDVKIGRQEVQRLAETAEAQPQAAKKVITIPERARRSRRRMAATGNQVATITT